ncbi:protein DETOXIFICATION 33-like [Macadamia integrifolia]|uniref:protein DETOXIFICATION 33-like n=1 Tax=Macadamia integrifolia TaxID=60698 RepID=UPI001C4F0C83|nr:protein DETOXIFICATION 33-like [Macadamia integrifolia]
MEEAPLLHQNRASNGHEEEEEEEEEEKVEKSLAKRAIEESNKLWMLSGPAISTSICQYSLGAITQTFAGQVSTLALAVVSVENSVIAGLAFGVMMGMGSASETLCGQVYGAGKITMLGIYMQRSWVILFVTSLILVPVYVFSPPILKLFGQTDEIADATGRFAIWMLPQLFAYALNFPIEKFLQAQGKFSVMACVAGVVLLIHVLLSWLLILKLGWGLVGAAVSLNLSWWLVVSGKLAYIFIWKSDGAWTGFSFQAFKDLFGFVKLSLASAVMLCLEIWYLMIVIVITGHLKNPLIAVDAISICMNINGWDFMIALGFNAAISVRVSNELGAGKPGAAKFSVLVVSTTSIAIGLVCMALVLGTRDHFPYLFSNSAEVRKEVTNLAPLLATTVLLNSLQPVLSGVAIGAGWQALVAYINIGCYYMVGLPAGLLLGFKFGFGVEGIWGGMIGGIVLQTIILTIITSCTNWKKEALEAENRIRKWGGSVAED